MADDKQNPVFLYCRFHDTFILSRIFPTCGPLVEPCSRKAHVHLQAMVSPGVQSRPSARALDTIAICTVGELFGGVERHVLGLISGLASRGVQALLILFHEGELAAQARALAVEPVVLAGCNAVWPATSRRLARILERNRVHVVHVHGYKATVYCAFARAWHPFSMVKTEHGLPEPVAGGAIRALRNRLYHWLDGVATRAIGATVCYVTEDLRRHYERAHSGLRVTVIPNGVESMERQQFPRPQELQNDWFNLLIVGRLETVKGQQLAIEAMAALGQSADIHLHILGAGPREADLRSLAESLGISDRVHILGFRHNVYAHIAHCDILLVPSLHEGLPYILLEAMAIGVPVIASQVGGLAEVIENDVTGLLITPNDATALARAIRRLKSDSSLRERLGHQGQLTQRAKYSLTAMVDKYLTVYAEATRLNS
jgi:glycosyltransferase involved in cell wall biosynthesis